jgi:hypothetical protein
MGDQFLLIQEKIEAVLTLLKSTSDTEVRKTYLLEFRLLLEEADKLFCFPLPSRNDASRPIRQMPKDPS